MYTIFKKTIGADFFYSTKQVFQAFKNSTARFLLKMDISKE